jgi:uncharacterized ferredoxin-like protein
VTSEYVLIDIIALIIKDRARTSPKRRKGEDDEIRGFD